MLRPGPSVVNVLRRKSLRELTRSGAVVLSAIDGVALFAKNSATPLAINYFSRAVLGELERGPVRWWAILPRIRSWCTDLG